LIPKAYHQLITNFIRNILPFGSRAAADPEEAYPVLEAAMEANPINEFELDPGQVPALAEMLNAMMQQAAEAGPEIEQGIAAI